MLISMSPSSRRRVRQARERPRTEQFEVRGLWGDCIRRHADGEAGPMTPDPPIPHLVGADKCRLNGALTTLPATSLPHGPIASQPHRTQHDQRRGFAVEHRDPPIPETVPPKVPRRLATALSPSHDGAIGAMTSSSPWEWRGHYGGYGAR